jgi:hypothetical protein
MDLDEYEKMRNTNEYIILRDQTFIKLKSCVQNLRSSVDLNQIDKTVLLFKNSIKELRGYFDKVNTADLPWSALFNYIRNNLDKIGWHYDLNVLNSKEKMFASDTVIKLDEIVNFIEHWTPKQKEQYISKFFGKKYPTREEIEPEDNLDEIVSKDEDRINTKKILRVLPPNFYRRKYVSLRQGLDKHNRAGRHWGQRKLLFNEIELLILHAHEDYRIVYAGSAPGNHISILDMMFEVLRLKYILVDPAPFFVKQSPNIEIRTGAEGLFSDEYANFYSKFGNKLIFVSDIRREHDSEQQIIQDQEDQMRWHLIMKPRASMFKFRLPWEEGKTPYLSGKVYIQPYAQMHSTETRLIATSSEIYDWDNKIYEEQCFFFNTVTRMLPYDHGVKGAGLKLDYDCASEVEILRLYFERFDSNWSRRRQSEKNELISSLSVLISYELAGARGKEWIAIAQNEDMRDSGYQAANPKPAFNFIKSLTASRNQSQQEVGNKRVKILDNPNSNSESQDVGNKKVKIDTSKLKAESEKVETSVKDKYPRPLTGHEGWIICWSKSNQREYFFHQESNKSVWRIEDI